MSAGWVLLSPVAAEPGWSLLGVLGLDPGLRWKLQNRRANPPKFVEQSDSLARQLGEKDFTARKENAS
jgi:hypothetical protein